MSFNIPIRSFNLPDLSKDIAMGFIFYVVGKGLDHLFKRSSFKINKSNISKNYQWGVIFYHMIHFVLLANLQNGLEKIRMNKLSKKLTEYMMMDVLDGFTIFAKIEPEASKKILLGLTKFIDQSKIDKITGIKNRTDFRNIFE